VIQRTVTSIGLALLAVMPGATSRPGRERPAGPAAAVVRMNMASKPSAPGPVILLAGSILEVRIAAPPNAPVTWGLAYDQTVLASGRVVLDRTGEGTVRLTAPDVRHRAVCELAAKGAGRAVRRSVVVYPTSLLSHATRRVAGLEIAVIDPTARTQRALTSQGIDFESLDGQIARDFARNRTVILAGFRKAERLVRAHRGFSRRVKGGMSLVILNPPAGWTGWGMKAVRRAKPGTGAVRLAREIGRFVPAADLGTGPWELALEAGAGSKGLAWWGTRKAARTPGQAPARGGMLVAARDAGKGRVVVSVLPETRHVDTDAVGRGMLSEMILWLVEPQRPGRPGVKETDHVGKDSV